MGDSDSENTPSIWSNLNLPQILLGPAGAALSRLIGKATDIPAAKLESRAQKIKDETGARSTVTRAIAQVVAKQAVKDPTIMERAMESFVAKEFRKQENKEAVAKKTAELLAEAPPPPVGEPPAEPEADWMNVFELHAENASTERMREMWGRVLAGEIRKPKSFSLKTLGFIAQLDQEVAEIFEKYANKVVGSDMIPAARGLKSPELDELLQLEEFGLITGVAGDLNKKFSIEPAHDGLLLSVGDNALLLKRKSDINPQKIELNIPCILLTRVGREVYRILAPKFDVSSAQEFIKVIPKHGSLAEIRLYDMQTQTEGELLWEHPKPPEEQTTPPSGPGSN